LYPGQPDRVSLAISPRSDWPEYFLSVAFYDKQTNIKQKGNIENKIRENHAILQKKSSALAETGS